MSTDPWCGEALGLEPGALILRGSDHAAGCAAVLGPAATTGAVVAALGLRNRATASVGGGGGAAPPREAWGRGDFYSDTAGARLCLVMVTCARSAPPPCALRWRRPGLGDGGGARARPWRGEWGGLRPG